MTPPPSLCAKHRGIERDGGGGKRIGKVIHSVSTYLKYERFFVVHQRYIQNGADD